MNVYIAAHDGIDLAAFNARDMQEAKAYLATTLAAALRLFRSNGKPLLAQGAHIALRRATPLEVQEYGDWLDDLGELAVRGEHVVRVLLKTDPVVRH